MALKDKTEAMQNRIYRFAPDMLDWTSPDKALAKKLLGGKGASLVSMIEAGLPVPPGFTITTEVCNEYRQTMAESAPLNVFDKAEFLNVLMLKVANHMDWLEGLLGFKPLVSVRSGAPVSMPGMMDTILNVGLTKENLPEWADRIGERAAFDSYRRLIQMLGATAYEIPKEKFDEALDAVKNAAGVKQDSELNEDQLKDVIYQFEEIFHAYVGDEFPTMSVYEQLRAAITAVFDSWGNERAIHYRKMNGISEEMGTAVNVQAMVFGNLNDQSGSGVLFTRNPSTGEPSIMAEYLVNAQGEDVVSGVRIPDNLIVDAGVGPDWQQELHEVCSKLEAYYGDMVDVEFTVMNGKLWILQSRVGKRSAAAAFRIAVDLVEEGVISPDNALDSLTPEQFKVLKRPAIAPGFDVEPNLVGLPACPGVVTGKPVFSAKSAIDCKEPCILITHETTPDDIAGMDAAVGILTQTGGATSHAAVVARAMDKACITGCTALDLGADWKDVKQVTICGATGRVWLNVEVPVVDASSSHELGTVMFWAASGERVSTPAYDEKWPELEQVVHAADWWGQVEMMDAVLADMAEQTQPLYLDIRDPREFRPQTDKVLEDAFALSVSLDLFDLELRSYLLEHASELAPHVTLVVGQLENPGNPLFDHYAREHAEDGSTGAPLETIVLRRLAA